MQSHGRRIATKYMTLLAQPNSGPADRLGIIASRRLGGAVLRNRAKRRLRDVFRRGAALEPAARPLDIVVIPRRELLTAPPQIVEAEFWAAVGRLRGRR